jgi:transcriptional regulator with XRE-family HTH domain
MTPFGASIRRLRKNRSLQQTQVALEVGISPCYYNAIENGKKGAPSKKVLIKLEKVLASNDDERRDFWDSASNSKMAYTVPIGIGVHEHTMINQIWKQLGTISTQQATCIEFILKASERG